MGDKPIIFSAPMVRALLDGRKTQTRRVLPKSHPRFPHHNQINMDVLCFDPKRPEAWYWDGVHDRVGASYPLRYAVGDRLYVREQCATWGRGLEREPVEFPVVYAADDAEWDDIKHDARNSKTGDEWKIRPSIHMPRWASRLTLTVTDVRVTRLQDISEADAAAEGCECDTDGWRDYLFPSTQCCGTARESYRTLWNSLHGPDAWDANPWVVAVSFTVQRGNIDQLAQVAK